MFKDVPSFLDWLTLGVVSGFLDANTVRYNEMVRAPNVYSVANWLAFGDPGDGQRCHYAGKAAVACALDRFAQHCFACRKQYGYFHSSHGIVSAMLGEKRGIFSHTPTTCLAYSLRHMI